MPSARARRAPELPVWTSPTPCSVSPRLRGDVERVRQRPRARVEATPPAGRATTRRVSSPPTGPSWWRCPLATGRPRRGRGASARGACPWPRRSGTPGPSTATRSSIWRTPTRTTGRNGSRRPSASTRPAAGDLRGDPQPVGRGAGPDEPGHPLDHFAGQTDEALPRHDRGPRGGRAVPFADLDRLLQPQPGPVLHRAPRCRVGRSRSIERTVEPPGTARGPAGLISRPGG